MILLFSKLLIAHLIGDFILFRDKELKEKGKTLWKSQRLLLHSIVHFAAALIAIWDIFYWWLALLIGISHYLLEVAIKRLLVHRPQWAFVIDQLLHIAVIFFAAAFIYVTEFGGPSVLSIDIAISPAYIAGLLSVTFPAAKFIEVFLSQWPPAKSADRIDKIKGLANAGLWIGILERVLIYIFITTGHWEGIGFLLGAKSVFRFGDLTNSKDISLTEYIMVGTFLSFCLAIAAGLITNYFLG